MQSAEFWIRVIFLRAAVLIVLPIGLRKDLYIDNIGEWLDRHNKIRICIWVILMTVSILYFASMFLVVSEEKQVTGYVTNVYENGSMGGMLDTYEFIVVDENGNEEVYYSLLGMPIKFCAKLGDIKKGDKVTITYSGTKYMKAIHDLELIE